MIPLLQSRVKVRPAMMTVGKAPTPQRPGSRGLAMSLHTAEG